MFHGATNVRMSFSHKDVPLMLVREIITVSLREMNGNVSETRKCE